MALLRWESRRGSLFGHPGECVHCSVISCKGMITTRISRKRYLDDEFTPLPIAFYLLSKPVLPLSVDVDQAQIKLLLRTLEYGKIPLIALRRLPGIIVVNCDRMRFVRLRRRGISTVIIHVFWRRVLEKINILVTVELIWRPALHQGIEWHGKSPRKSGGDDLFRNTRNGPRVNAIRIGNRQIAKSKPASNPFFVEPCEG